MSTTAPTLTARLYPVPREDAVAALRKLADLIESTHLPVPQGIHAQFTADWEDRAVIGDIAEAYGMDFKADADRVVADKVVGYAGIYRVEYTIYASRSEVSA